MYTVHCTVDGIVHVSTECSVDGIVHVSKGCTEDGIVHVTTGCTDIVRALLELTVVTFKNIYLKKMINQLFYFRVILSMPIHVIERVLEYQVSNSFDIYIYISFNIL